MLYCFLICLGIWLVVGFITFVKFIKKYKTEVKEDNKRELVLLCLAMCIFGPISMFIIKEIEEFFKDFNDTIDETEKL